MPKKTPWMFAPFLLLALRAQAIGQSDLPWNTGTPSPRIEKLEQQIRSGNAAAVAEFWSELKTRHTPLIEPITGDPNRSLVTFIYRGSPETKAVVLYCQLMLGRDPSVNTLARLGDTDVWFKTYALRNDMRLSYSFMPNPSAESINSPDAGVPDPLNPKTGPSAPYMGHSVLELPAAPPQPWIGTRQGVPQGKVEELQIQSRVLKSQRRAWIYTPAGFDRLRPAPYPVLICFDGGGYVSPNYMSIPTIIDNLVFDKKIPPIVAVMVDQSPRPNRNLELTNNQSFLDFVADELLPRVRERWHATANPAETIVTGSSTGGLASAFFAFRRADVFGNVLSQSGAFWPGKERNDPEREWLTRQFESSAKLPVRFVLQVGLLERGPTPGNGPSILDTNRHLRSVLERKGYEVHYSEIAGGHEPLSWRGGIADGLIQLAGLQR